MKKIFNLSVILAFLLAGFSFTSCSEDDNDDDDDNVGPALTLTQEGNDSEGNYILRVQGRVGSSDLSTITVKNAGVFAQDINGKTWNGGNGTNEEGKISGSSLNQTITFDKNLPSKLFEFTLTDKNNLTDTKSITAVSSTPPPTQTPLSSPADLEWIRDKQSSADLSQYGLLWNSTRNMHAIIQSISNTKLVVLDTDTWTTITTKEALKEAIDQATGTSTYDAIELLSTPGNKTLDIVLGVDKHGTGEYYLIHLTSAVTYKYPGTTDYKYTIAGQSKN